MNNYFEIAFMSVQATMFAGLTPAMIIDHSDWWVICLVVLVILVSLLNVTLAANEIKRLKQ